MYLIHSLYNAVFSGVSLTGQEVGINYCAKRSKNILLLYLYARRTPSLASNKLLPTKKMIITTFL